MVALQTMSLVVTLSVPETVAGEFRAVANDTNYGLHAAVYTNDLDTAIRAARTLRAGTVSVKA